MTQEGAIQLSSALDLMDEVLVGTAILRLHCKMAASIRIFWLIFAQWKEVETG